MPLKKNYIVEKRNILNELRSNSLSLQELRLFSIYLAKINPRNRETRLVRFKLEDFQKIMELGKLNHLQMQHTVNSLLSKVLKDPRKDGGVDFFQLFKKCTIAPDEDGVWYVEINAHDDALPLLFAYRIEYFNYELWNVLRLKSRNQLRMYEILKQYEYAGERFVTLDELRTWMGIDEGEYPRYNDFRDKVLEVCRKALSAYTDIQFTYEPHGKRGRGGKVHGLKFTITKNENYTNPVMLDEFIDRKDIEAIAAEWEDVHAKRGMDQVNANSSIDQVNAKCSIDPADADVVRAKADRNAEGGAAEDDDLDGPPADGAEENYFARVMFPFLAEACGNEFGLEEIQVLYNLAVKNVQYKGRAATQLAIYDFIKQKYDELQWRATTTTIHSRMAYLKKMIEAGA